MENLTGILHILYSNILSLIFSLIEILRVRSTTTFVHGATSATLKTPEGPITLQRLVTQQVPSLFRTYTPTWHLPFGDMQTIWGSAVHKNKGPKISYERKYILVPDGGCISVDITPPVSPEVPAESPIVIIIHGLLGGSHVNYVRSAAAQLSRPLEQGGLGLRIAVMNLRGCSRTPVLSSLLYHPGMTDDLRSTVLYISSRFPKARLFGLGFSLGAGYLTNYLGEEGDQAPLVAGLNISNVWDYSGCSLELNHGRFMNRILYNPFLGKGHQNIIKKYRHAFWAHDGLQAALDKRWATMSWFTAQFAAQTAGVDPQQFLYDTTCAKAVPGVRVPLLCLNSRDDPLLSEKYLPVKRIQDNKYVAMVLTDRGGHLGWFNDDKDERGDLEQWYTPAILEYFRAMLRVETIPASVPRTTLPDRIGMVRQVGRPNVGFCEVSADVIFSLEASLKDSMNSGESHEVEIADRDKMIISNYSTKWPSLWESISQNVHSLYLRLAINA